MKEYQFLRVILFFLTFIFCQQYSIAENYFWIGGNGNWSDINHWATTSGGSILHIQTPTSHDDVFFDANSFSSTDQTVNVNTENAICKSMDWTGSLYQPTLSGITTNNIRIYGSITLIDAMNQNYNGTFSFEGQNLGNIIKSAGHAFNNHITFDGIGGSWELLDDLSSIGNIYIHNGTFQTANHDVICHTFLSTQTNLRIIDISNSNLQLSDGWNINGSNLSLNAQNSLIEISGGHFTNTQGDQGDTLKLWNLHMENTSQVLSTMVYSTFKNIIFSDGGLLKGNLSADSVIFNTTINNCGVSEHTNIDFLSLKGTINNVTGNNYIHALYGESIFITTGNNSIDSAYIIGDARIIENNLIGKIYIKNKGVVRGQNTINDILFGKTSFVYENNDFGNCFFNCDGYIYGENNFDTLTFTPGFRYFFENNTTQTIENTFNVSGNCQAPIFIKSLYNGYEATINKLNGSIDGTFLSLRDIHITGATANALNSVDLGNNDGWTIEEFATKDLYWVNGSGNWDDINHWSLSSGGAGGECPPREIDNVFVDSQSLLPNDSIRINVKNAVCNSFTWENGTAGYLSGPDTNFHKVYGSLFFSEQFSNQFKGETHFEATSVGQIIDSKEKLFLNSIRLQGKGGEWKLGSKLQTTDTLCFSFGDFHSNQNNIHTRIFNSTDTNLRLLNLYEDTIFISGNGFAWQLDAINYSMDADSSVLVYTSGGAEMESRNHARLTFNNVHFREPSGTITNLAYCVYNVVTFHKEMNLVRNNCTIDTVIFIGPMGSVFDQDTIKTAIFYEDDGNLLGKHIVEIAYFYGYGKIEGLNKVDTALFYDRAQIIQKNEIDTTIIFNEALIEGQNNIRTATLKDNAYLKGNNTFNDLFFEYSKVYQFEHDSTQTITNKLVANGLCTGPIFLFSDLHGSEAIIEKTNGEVSVDYANIRDIRAEGPEIPFIANSSIDLGGNTNWEIYEHEALALYWVGNTGNWSDSLHWSYESGGEPGYCIPSPVDNVFFDHNSFSSPSEVHVDVVIATCHDMTWTGSEFIPQFKSITDIPDQRLYIYGSLTLIDEMENNFDGIVYFAAKEENQFIISANNSFINDVIYEGENGSWYLVDNLAVEGSIRLQKGSLRTQGLPVTGINFISTDSTTRSLSLATTTFTVGNEDIAGSWNVYSKNFNLDADSSKIISYDSVNSKGTGHNDILRYNDVVFKSPGTLRHDNIYCKYDDVIFEMNGTVKGNCKIDTVLFMSQGLVNGGDSINYVHFSGTGILNGVESVINTSIFNNSGLVSGECEINTSLFYSAGEVSGNNTIDTTIFFGNGSIQGNNTFKSQVKIYGNGSIVGENNIQKNLIIHGVASIYDNNLIHNALLLNEGNLGGSNIFDILSFTAGKKYTLTASTSQTVLDTFNILGNNCFPIDLVSSSNNSIQAEINMPDGFVLGDFINMKDIAATGNTQFFAGGHSDDISNNSGWIWDNAPGYIFGLGEDLQFFCDGETLELSTENFNGNDNTIYEWWDGSMGPTYEVTEPGVYGIIVHYSDDCSVPSQVTIEELPSPQIDLGDDSEICEGESLELDSGEEYEAYLWNNGSTETSINIESSGLYWLEVTNDVGCSKRDSLILGVLDAPDVELGNDIILHKGESVILDAGYPGAIYEWSSGETTQTINAYGLEDGNLYWVDVYYEYCYGSDSIVIDQYPYCSASVPTAFSPNNDGLNDTLFVYGSGLQSMLFQVYDRYGKLVFESKQLKDGWDGKINGAKQEIDVYTFYLKATCFDGLVTEKKGNITLLK